MTSAILGLGSDLLRIERIARMGLRDGKLLLDRLLAPAERLALAGRGEARADWPACAPEIAGLMACKEAFFKALGTGLVRPLRWPDVAVRRSRIRPSITLDGASAAAFSDRGGTGSMLSLEGNGNFVLATVLLLGRHGTKDKRR